MDGFWTFLIVAVVLQSIVKLASVKARTRLDGQATQAQNAALTARMDKLEQRMANLETIVLEHEKLKNFERSL